jgi:hypothetical protein
MPYASDFFEVLHSDQAPAASAAVLDEDRWLPAAAEAADVPMSDLALSAGPLPATTLVQVRMEAGSAEAARQALAAVVDAAKDVAARQAGPFDMHEIAPMAEVTSLSPSRAQLNGALGAAGALAGASVGAGVLAVARRRRRTAAASLP